MNAGIRLAAKSVMLASALLFAAVSPAFGQTYAPAWEQLDKRPTPNWFADAKFGIFIHWGLYSVPAWCEERGAPVYVGLKNTKNPQWQRLQTPGSPTWEYHRRVYGENFQYKDFADVFKAQLFDPAEWAELFRRSGAKYVVLTARFNADSYCLWPAPDSQGWNSVETGPHRDLVGDLTAAVRAKGLKMGLYYGLIEWYNPYSNLYEADFSAYVERRLHVQLRDLIERYQPSLLFTDGDWAHTADAFRSQEFLAWLYSQSPCRTEIVVNDRWGKCRHQHGGYYTTEYGAGFTDASHPWEENRTIGRSFSYNRADALQHYLTDRELLLLLADIVSRGGNLLLGIGPRDDGRIPVIMEERLAQMGKWLDVNGEAIYGARCWRRSCQWSEGQRPEIEYGKAFRAKYDIGEMVSPTAPGAARVEAFFTYKDGSLYAIAPRWPRGRFLIHDIACSPQTNVSVLGLKQAFSWTGKDGGMEIEVPPLAVEDAPCQGPYVFKLTAIAP